MRFALMVATLVLASSATKTAEPVVVVREVKVPCKVAEPAQPTYAADDVDLFALLFDLVKSLVTDREQRKPEAVGLGAAVRACE